MNDCLNEEQKIAVAHVEGPCIVSACPGSGKTRVVTHRAATMLRSGIPAGSLLLITFTNKAAREMKARLIKLCLHNNIDGAEAVTISTFHALCAKFLREGIIPGAPRGNFSILDEDEALSLMVESAEEVGLDKDDAKALHWQYAAWRETKDGWLDRKKEATFIDPIKIDCIRAYESHLVANNAVDFAGLIMHVARGLSQHESVRDRLSRQYRYVIVDEAQDTNDAQFEIAMTIAQHGNIMVVGDADQAIYEWRGAKPDNMVKMQNNLSGCRLIRLQTNYRSTPNITEPASQLICKNPNRLNAQISPAKKDGAPVLVNVHRQRDDESVDVCKKIKYLISKGVPNKKIAILFRVNSQSRAFEMALRQFSIPYKLTGAFKFLDREEVKDIVSMIKFAVNPCDSISLCRFANKPKRGLGAAAISTVAPRLSKKISDTIARLSNDPALSSKNRDSICSVLKNFIPFNADSHPGQAVEGLVLSLEYRKHLRMIVKEEAVLNEKLDNVEELIKYAHAFAEQKHGNLHDFCMSLSLADDEKGEKDDSVQLMSIHASKGLEFNTVFVVCCEEGSIPHDRSIKDLDPSKINEERRLMYVAMTRAEERLCLTMSLLDGRSRSSENKSMAKMYSRFLEEAGLINKQEFAMHIKDIQERY